MRKSFLGLASLGLLFTLACSSSPEAAPAEPLASLEVVLDPIEPIEPAPFDENCAAPPAEADVDRDAPETQDEEFGCGCGADIAPLPEVEAARDPRAGDILVNMLDGIDTVTLRIDGETGVVVGREAAHTIAVGDKTWTIVQSRRELTVGACDSARSLDGSSTALTLTAADGSEQVVVPHRSAPADATGFHHAPTVLRTVGHYVFVVENVITDTCERHESASAGFVWDVSRGARLDLRDELHGVSTIGERALAEWGAGADPHIRGVYPELDSSGNLSIELDLVPHAPDDGDLWKVRPATPNLRLDAGPTWLTTRVRARPGYAAFMERNPLSWPEGLSVVGE